MPWQLIRQRKHRTRSPPTRIATFEIVEESEDFFENDDTETEPVIQMMKEYPELFHLPGDQLPATHILQHTIFTTDDALVFAKQYRYPPVYKEEMQNQVNKPLKDGIIEDSMSPFKSPVWMVPK